MTMHTVFFKERQDQNVAENSSVNSVSSAAARWSGLRSQPPAVSYGETFALSEMASLELKQPKEHQPGKGNTNPFTLFSGDCKTSDQKAQSQAITMEYGGGHLELGFRHPLVGGKYQYQYAESLYGMNTIHGTQIAERAMLMPMRMNTDDGGPIFVNPKQHNGIMRRRRKRAEAELANKVLRFRKPYLHLSRHLHAMRRPRGNGGRFLNTKKNAADRKQATDSKISHGANKSKGTNDSCSSRSTSPTSEVTSHHLTATHHPFHNQMNIRLFPLFSDGDY